MTFYSNQYILNTVHLISGLNTTTLLSNEHVLNAVFDDATNALKVTFVNGDPVYYTDSLPSASSGLAGRIYYLISDNKHYKVADGYASWTEIGGGGSVQDTYVITQPIFTDAGGLDADYTAGSWKYDGTSYSISPSTETLLDDKTNWYIYLEGDTSLHHGSYIPDGRIGLVRYTTSSGNIDELVNLGTAAIQANVDNLSNKVGEDDGTQKTASTPTYASNIYITNGDTHNIAIGKLDASLSVVSTFASGIDNLLDTTISYASGINSQLLNEIDTLTSYASGIYNTNRTISEAHKISGGDYASGYFSLNNTPINPISVSAFPDGGPMQINKSIVGATGSTPDFEMDTNKIYFKNVDGHSGLTGDWTENDVIIVTYFA
jgi:hypothetical protein